MSLADVLSRLRDFASKADQLQAKGHLQRAAENFGRAAEAARALGEDSVVTSRMLVAQADALLKYATFARFRVPELGNAWRAPCDGCVVLLVDAVAALERRRVAGTLQGRCFVNEEAWFVGQTRNSALAPLVGYHAFLVAGTTAIRLLSAAPLFDSLCSDARMQSFVAVVVNAADMMQQPRVDAAQPMPSEVEFTHLLSDFKDLIVPDELGLDMRPLHAAWQKLCRSGVLVARKINLELTRMVYQPDIMNAVDSAAESPDLRSCALQGCGAKEAHPQHFKRCSACKTVVYCCKEHQVEDWPAHKAACKAARKAAGAAAGGAPGPDAC